MLSLRSLTKFSSLQHTAAHLFMLSIVFCVRSKIKQNKSCLENTFLCSFYQKGIGMQTHTKKGPCRSSNPLLCTKIHHEIIKQIVLDLFLVKYKHYEKHHKESFPDAFSQKLKMGTQTYSMPVFAH